MKTSQLLATFLLAACYWGNAAELPSNFQTCKRSIPDMDECLKAAIQDALPKLEKGISKLNFPPTQPFRIPSITIGEGRGAVHLSQKFENVDIYNLIRAKLDNVKMELKEDNFRLIINATLAEVNIKADYDFDGRILLLPIKGQGKATITFSGISSDIHLHADIIKRKGVSYGEIKEMKMSIDPQKMTFQFDNLFNGDEKLGPELNAILNENWKEIWEDVRSGYEDAFTIILSNLANLVFHSVPLEKLFPH